MSHAALSIPPILAIGDPERGAWAVAAGDGDARMAKGRLGGEAATSPGTLESDAGGTAGRWRLASADGKLIGAARSADVSSGDQAPTLLTLDGSLPPGGDDASAAAGGFAFPGRPELRAGSVRLLAAWFAPDLSLGMTSVRPARSRGHDKDAISLTATGEPKGMNVFDPRLSSTYGSEAQVRRVGVEVWLGVEDKDDVHSLRMAGEASGAPARLELDGVSILAQPLLCHGRGRAGVGVYLLITAR